MKPGIIGTLIGFLFGVLFTVAGYFVGIVYGKPLLDQAKASEHWPTAEGTVIRSELDTHRSDGKTMYKADVAYEYEVQREHFESDRVWFGGGYSTNNRSEMQKIVADFPKGTPVTVYYNPDRPADAVLMPGAFTSSYAMFAGGMVALVLGGIALAVVVVKLLIVVVALLTAGGPDQNSQFPEHVYAEDLYQTDSRPNALDEPDDDGFPGIPGR